MAENHLIPGYILAEERILVPTVRTAMNNEVLNTERYQEALESNEYVAVVTDLDGVIVKNEYYTVVDEYGATITKNGVVDREAFDALMHKTILRPGGRVPLALGSGRTMGEIGEIVLPEIQRSLQEHNAEPLTEGDLTVFASNASVGIDIATWDVLYATELNMDEIRRLNTFVEFQTIYDIMDRQSRLLTQDGRRIIGRAKVINDNYTYTIGINPALLDLVDQESEDGRLAVQRFRSIYGNPQTILSVVQRLNRLFDDNGFGLNATSSGSLIDINSVGVSKGLAIDVMRQILARKLGRKLGDIRPEQILSIGDSTLGNDEPLTQRMGGFANKGPILPGSIYPIVIDEEGDQFQRLAKFLRKVKVRTLGARINEQNHVNEDYIVAERDLFQGMPNGEIKDKFDITGSQKISLTRARRIVDDSSIPASLREFFLSHASVASEEGKHIVYIRGKEYYEASSRAENVNLLEGINEILRLLQEFNISSDKKLSVNQRIVMLSLLDHAKCYVL